MSKLNMNDVALPQEVLDIGGTQYLVTAMPATKGLQFLESQQQAIESGKPDLALMKQVVCAYVTKDNMPITAERFDVCFARRLGHLRDLFNAVIQWNFGEVFLEPDSED